MQVTRKDIVSIAESSGLSVDLSNIQGSDSLREAGIDSLDIMTFYLGIEEKFNIKIPDDEIEALDTIDNIVAYIQNI
jgi:acyl carrier protein